MPMTPFTAKVIEVIQSIPYGKVSTYGVIASLAGNKRAARQVVRILHVYSRKMNLPWHRVVNREGIITIPDPMSSKEQQELLEQEGILLDADGKIDLVTFAWKPH